MTAGGRADRTGAAPDGRGLRLGIVVSRFNEHITSRLLAGAQQAIARCGIERPPAGDVVWVPGTWELPIAAQALARSARYDAIVCLGCVIRGETGHYEHVGTQAAAGIRQAALDTGVPVVFGVLTTENLDQALARSEAEGGENAGYDGARTAVEMAKLVGSITKSSA